MDKKLDEIARPAGANDILAEITRLSVHYAIGNKLSEGQMRSMLEDYVKDMAHIPLKAIQFSCQQWRTGREDKHRFFPKVGELIALAYSEEGYKKLRIYKANLKWVLLKCRRDS